MRKFTNKESKEIIIAILKGILHAIVIPLLIIVAVNSTFDGGYGFLTALVWIIAVGIAYNLFFKRKDISKIAFNISIALPTLLFIGYLFLSAMLYVA